MAKKEALILPFIIANPKVSHKTDAAASFFLLPIQVLPLKSKMKYMKPYNLFQELLKSNSELLKSNAVVSSRFLGLDAGDKYIGLAVSDTTNKVSSPLAVLLRKKSNIDLMAKDLQSLVSELSLGGFVFGAPFDRNKTSRDALQVKLFVDELCRTGELKGVKYTFWDESFSSKSVEMFLKSLKLHPAMEKSILDKFAATEILQGYLDFINRKQVLRPSDKDSSLHSSSYSNIDSVNIFK